MRTLSDLVVVEIAGSVAGAYCAKLFADQGALVTVVGDPEALTTHQRRYLNEAKATTAADNVSLGTADVVIESAAPTPLVARRLDDDQVVRVQISPFGATGPRAQWLSTDLTDYAISGHAYLYGDPDREPLAGPADQPAVASGLFGFIGAMAALHARDRLGGGQTVDISHEQVMVALHQFTLLRWQLTGDTLCRMGNRYTGQGQPNGLYPSADGWVSIACITDQQIESLLAITGLSHLLERNDIDSPMDFLALPHVLDPPLSAWLGERSTAEIVDLLQTMRIPAAPVLDMDGLLGDPQLLVRNFFKPLSDGSGDRVPGPPFSVTEVGRSAGAGWRPGPLANGALAGLKVLDLTRIWAGPLCTRILSDLGADVVCVEAPWGRGPRTLPEALVNAAGTFPDGEQGVRPWNRNGHTIKYALGKRSLALDLQSTAGQDVLARLLPAYHVLVENFSPRVMPQIGFDEERLHGLNHDLIYATMPGFGRSGPAENWLAYGSSVDSHAGLSSLIGYPDQVPWKGGVAWPDPIAGLHAAAAILSALWQSQVRSTGGVTIEAAQLEATVAAIGDRVLEAQTSGVERPNGNRRSSVAQNVYRCAGDDEWIAISALSEACLTTLASVVGLEEVDPVDPATLDRALARYALARNGERFAAHLQALAIPAAVVRKAPAIVEDEHLRARNAWVTVDQPDVGAFTAPVSPVGLAASPARVGGPAPTLGEHNIEVLAASGFSTAEIATLAADGTIVDQPPA